MSDLVIDFLTPSSDVDNTITGRSRELSSSILFIEPGSPEEAQNVQQRIIDKKNHYRSQFRRKHVKREKRMVFHY